MIYALMCALYMYVYVCMLQADALPSSRKIVRHSERILVNKPRTTPTKMFDAIAIIMT